MKSNSAALMVNDFVAFYQRIDFVLRRKLNILRLVRREHGRNSASGNLFLTKIIFRLFLSLEKIRPLP